MPSTPANEISQRINNLQAALADERLDGALIVQRADLFYFSGTGQDAHLYVPASGEPVLMVRKSLERAVEDSPISQVVQMNRPTDLRAEMRSRGHVPATLGMELDVLPVNNYRMYEGVFAGVEIKDASFIIRNIRSVKSDYELNLIRRAAEMNDAMFASVRDILREGISEIELAGELEAFYRRHGHQGYVRVRSFNQEVFYGHVMSGEDLALPSCSVGPTGGRGTNASLPQGAGFRKIGRNEPVSIDFVATCGGYLADQARTFYLGEPPDQMAKIHDVALTIQDEICRAGKAGSTAEELYDLAIKTAEESGFAEFFMGHPQPVPFVGHGVGLELDELPLVGKRSGQVLREGMVIALEPKFILPDRGMAGIENTFCVTKQGLEKITMFDDKIQVV